jgi:hypothetical protein
MVAHKTNERHLRGQMLTHASADTPAEHATLAVMAYPDRGTSKDVSVPSGPVEASLTTAAFVLLPGAGGDSWY